MKKLALLCTAFILSMPSSSFATNFQGPFLGLNIGYSFGDVEYSYEDGTTGFGDFSEDSDFDGFEGGIFAGYRHQFTPKFNLGLELGYLMSGADGSFRLDVGANTAALNYEKENELYVSLRPGFLVNENTLAYGVIGYQRADFSADVLLNGAILDSDDEDFDGYHLGVGLEHLVANGVSLRGEYRYIDYSDETYAYENAQRDTLGVDENVFRVGLTYNFGAGL